MKRHERADDHPISFLARTWPKLDEREYIVTEARTLFKKNKKLTDPAEIEAVQKTNFWILEVCANLFLYFDDLLEAI